VSRVDPLTVHFDGPREVHEANRAVTGAPAHDDSLRTIREFHADCEALGVSPELAYLNAVVTVTRASVAAGPEAVVAACQNAGLVYLQLQPLRSSPGDLALSPEEYLGFYREALRCILDRNEAGVLLVEKRLALHLEALSTIDPRRPRDDQVVARGSPGCASCPYDPYCGARLIRDYTMDDVMVKERGSDWCQTSMGTFDHVFALLRSERGPALRGVYRRWMAARDAVAARLADRK
jgi:hypothetical protein